MSSKSAEWTLVHSAAEWAMLKNFDGLPYFLTYFSKIDSTIQISWVSRGYAPTAPLAIIEITNKNLPKSCLPALLTWVSTFYKHIQRHIGWLKISDDAQLRLTAASLKPYRGICGGLPSLPPHRPSHPCEWLAPWCPWRCNPIAICSNWRSGACRGPAHPFRAGTYSSYAAELPIRCCRTSSWGPCRGFVLAFMLPTLNCTSVDPNRRLMTKSI